MGGLTVKGGDFYRDGEKTTLVSGTIHYFRVVPDYWEDRLKKLRACGFNAVETYTCWNLHERREGVFDFSGGLDIGRFIDTAASLGLMVILRPGPYICAEWDMGGLPSWLLTYGHMRLRCNDPLFLEKVGRYYKELFRHVTPRLAANGGNVVAVQVENEYGSYGDDKDYLRAIADIYRDNGVDCLLFTSDGTAPFMLGGGTLDGVLATVNFGSNPAGNFGALREFRPGEPVMCMEYWNGWFDHWYEEHHTRTSTDTAQVLDEMLSAGASVNFYMFHGGTNFGFTNGANYDDRHAPTVTSYDYDAPLNEAGDLTPKYFEVKEVLEKHFGKAPAIPVGNLPKAAYGEVALTEAATLFDSQEALGVPIRAAAPLTMEELGQDFGFVLYTTELRGPFEELPLVLDGVHDRALIYIDGQFRGVKQRDGRRDDDIRLGLARGESVRLDILVENMGRVNYGRKLRDEKGLTGGVRLGQRYHFGWSMTPMPLDDLAGLRYAPWETGVDAPTFLRGRFPVTDPADTFLRLDGFTKGVAFINGFNLGRYWNPAGPQKTLYLPAPLLRAGENELVIFELEHSEGNRVLLTDTPDLG